MENNAFFMANVKSIMIKEGEKDVKIIKIVSMIVHEWYIIINFAEFDEKVIQPENFINGEKENKKSKFLVSPSFAYPIGGDMHVDRDDVAFEWRHVAYS